MQSLIDSKNDTFLDTVWGYRRLTIFIFVIVAIVAFLGGLAHEETSTESTQEQKEIRDR